MSQLGIPTIREAVGVFQSERDLEAAIDDLLAHGFDRAELSLLAPATSVDEQLGHRFSSVTELEDSSAVPTTAYVSTEAVGDAQGAVIGGLMYIGAFAALVPVVASGGALAAALIAATLGSGGGGAIGAVLARIIGKRHARYISDQLERGGLLLWVRTWNEADEKRAIDILSAHSGSDVHVHGLPERHAVLDEHYSRAAPDLEEHRYRGETYIRSGDQERYGLGTVFPSEEDIKSHIDRHLDLQMIKACGKDHAVDIEAVLTDPASQFETPAALMKTVLPDVLKIEILKRWAYGERELEVASDDGMPVSGREDRLQEIKNSILLLQAG